MSEADKAPYDLIIIGGGPAGYTAAVRAAQLGMKTACVEKRKTLGGTCLNVGCIPSKALLDSSEHFAFLKTKVKKHGVIVGDVQVDLPVMMKRKDDVVRQLTGGIDYLFKKHKVDRVLGTGKMLAAKQGLNQVEVDTGDGKKVLSTRFVLLATGSEPIELPFLKFDGKRILSSTEALSIPEIPKHLVVIGGGYIGLELGSVWLRLGSKVTVVEYVENMLPVTDQQVARELQKSLTKQGMDIKLGTKCLGADVSATGAKVKIEGKDKAQSVLDADYVLVAAGRKAYSEGLGLENIGVTRDERGRVQIDDHFRTPAANVFAVGDLVRGAMLAHKAEDEGVAAVEIMNGQAGHVNYLAIPAVIYTWPEVASVGYTEEELKTKGMQYKSGSFPFMANGRAKAMDETEGFVKVLADAKTDRVLGVHIIGPRASDMIAEAMIVMEFGGSSEDIGRSTHGHPTLSEVLKHAALNVEGRSTQN